MNTYDEIIVDIVGNVESGKSLYMVFYHILIWWKEVWYDYRLWNWLSKSCVLNLKHEKDFGRTLFIAYYYIKFTEPNRIILLVNLAGHKQYLKTTITNIFSSYSEYGLILVVKNIIYIWQKNIILF